MSQLIVQGLEETTTTRLERRAARHGQSAEAEARDIIRDALKHEEPGDERLGTRIADRFRGGGLKPHETIDEFRGSALGSPFGE